MSETTQQSNGQVETSHHPETDPQRKDKNYYGIPPIKQAHWTWQIWLYFWIGGIGAGAHLASVMGLILGWKDKAFFRASRYTVLIALILSPILLIWDLGRPERFYNMLRIVKLRSPMSLGTWALTLFGNFAGLVAARQAAEDGFLGHDNFLARAVKLIPNRALSVVSLPFGLFVGAYTGLLIAATSVPMWARNAILMGPTFLSSAVSNGLSMISFILHLGEWGEEKTLAALRRAERAVLVIEALLIAASLVRMGRWSKPLFSKKLGPLFAGGTLLGGIVAPFVILSGKQSRERDLLASALVLVGGLIFRYVMVVGGRHSANDPEAYFTFAKSENSPGQEG